MQPCVRAVILDMDGLMLDTEPIYRAAWQHAARHLGFELDDATYARFVGRPSSACERELQTHFGADFPLDRFRADWMDAWRARVYDVGIAIKPGLLALLAALEKRGVPVAIATSSTSDDADMSLRCTGLLGRFGVVVTGDQVQCGKPAPDIYLECARRLERLPSECLAIEDSDTGVVAASRAGMTVLQIPDLAPPSDASRRVAFRILHNLFEAHDVIVTLL